MHGFGLAEDGDNGGSFCRVFRISCSRGIKYELACLVEWLPRTREERPDPIMGNRECTLHATNYAVGFLNNKLCGRMANAPNARYVNASSPVELT